MSRWQYTRYTFHSHKKNAGQGRAKALFLTDLHNSDWGENFRILTDAIEEENPDFLLVGGDMITAVPDTETAAVEALMRELASAYPVFYACGNHEYRLKLYRDVYGDACDRYFRSLIRAGVVFLPNRDAGITVGGLRLHIYGFNGRRRFYKRFRHDEMDVSEITRIFGSRPEKNAVSILLAHTPKYIETYFKWGADLTLCGHYHGGIARLGTTLGLIDPDLSLFTRRAKGRFDHGEHACIVSAGLGEHSIGVRFNNPREITVLEITAGDQYGNTGKA